MRNANILIVEDSNIVAIHLKATLESEGYCVVGQCTSGEDALKFVEHTIPNLVLMDIMLQGNLDGIETAAILHSRYKLPVIYITALTDKDTINRAKVTEPYGYLTKPFEDTQICTVIEMALYKHDAESRLRQSEEKYYSTVRSISDCVLTVDADLSISYLNPSCETLMGYSLAEVAGKPVLEIFRVVDMLTNEPINPIQCSLSNDKANRLPENIGLQRRSGVVVPIGESSISNMFDATGSLSGFILVFKDMTVNIEYANLQRELKRNEIAGVIAGQEKERLRIARELHDGLGQMLNAIKMNVGVITSDPKQKESLQRLLDEAITESVRISENLTPAQLRDFPLAVCLKSFCSRLSKNIDVDILFHSEGNDPDLEQHEKVNFYRIAQESVNNAIKHGRATQIDVTLSTDDDAIRLIIEDNGSSSVRTRDTLSSGSGLVNMKDRAFSMGGTFVIENASQGGTRVAVAVPSRNTNLITNDQHIDR